MSNSYIKINGRILTLCLIIFQSIGIRFFEGQGLIISAIIILLSIENLKYFTERDFRILAVIIFFLVFSFSLNSNFTSQLFFFELSLIISVYLFLIQYKSKIQFLKYDFFHALEIFIYHSIIGYLLYLFLPPLFNKSINLNNSFYYIFYVSNGNFLNISRNTGLFWEPGVFQLVANLYLFYCIKFNKNNLKISIAGLAVLSSFSTTGLAILVLNFIYFLYSRIKSKRILSSSLFGVIIALIFFIPILKENVTDKIEEDNTSGLVRFRDIQVGLELIKENPVLGHGLFNSEYLRSKKYVSNIEQNLFYSGYLEKNGDMAGGYTNGFFGFLAAFGIPVSALFFFYYFKNSLVDVNFIEQLIFSLIPLITLLTEPISLTSLFLLFPFSFMIIKYKRKTMVKKSYA